MSGGDLRQRCHIHTNSEDDHFVGIWADSGQISVYFPLGYRLSEKERDLRRDILRLISLLREFSDQKEEGLHRQTAAVPQTVKFPVDAYLELIGRFLSEHTYYTEREPRYRTGDRGNTDWGRTVRRQRPLFQADGSPVYLRRTVRVSAPDENRLITQIHKYCVHVSFQRLGWLYTSEVPPAPDLPADPRRFRAEVTRKLNSTFNDGDRKLFSAMLAVLTGVDNGTDQRRFCVGTTHFERVWEKLIDRAFGVKDKTAYFPKVSWSLKQGGRREFEALYPDTVMLWNGKVYVLDAKYYRYGVTGNHLHLPEGKSIHKQITYGEYIATHEKFKRQGVHPTVYNAFLMPYNAGENPFGLTGRFEDCGEATGEWKGQDQPYERVQGILVDVNSLMDCARSERTSAVMELAAVIESGLEKG